MSVKCAGEQYTRYQANRTANLQHATATVTLLAQPTAEVRCTVTSLDASEAIVVDEVVTFDVGAPRFGPPIPISGILDAETDGDVSNRIRVWCTSSDRRFNGGEASKAMVNSDVQLPHISGMYPTITPYIATQVKMLV